MLSILIPTYNDDCVKLVGDLARQASSIDGLHWEILVADDASTNQTVVAHNQEINQTEHCRYIIREKNSGRAVIRNFLAQEAQGEWLLFVDADRSVVDPLYLSKYIKAGQEAPAVYGGYKVMHGEKGNLRYRYEKKSEAKHAYSKRNLTPYQDFNASNFMIHRDVMLAHPFDTRFRYYGYEDVLLGKQLCQANVPILHIDAPIGFSQYESNESFVQKTEEALRTLHTFQADLRGYSALISWADKLEGSIVKSVFLAFYRQLGKSWRKNILSSHPSLFLFKAYKLGYYLSL